MIVETADLRGAPRHHPSTFVEATLALLSSRLALTRLERLAQLLASPCDVNDNIITFTSVGLPWAPSWRLAYLRAPTGVGYDDPLRP